LLGVDECRVCGKKITVGRKDAHEKQMEAIRKPVVPEKVWREAGLLTPPTWGQWYRNPGDGCCLDCGLELVHRKYRTGIRFLGMYAILFGAAALIIFLVTFSKH
jgi:hypothetical protein